MRSYEQFWKELLPAYPITKGEITLPISTSLEDFDIDHKEIVIELDNITQQLFNQNNKAKVLASDGYGQGFIDCYSGNFTGIIRFDCMFDADRKLKLVEANTNWPDGLLMHDVTYSVLSEEKDTTHLDLFLKFFEKNEYIFILYEKGGFVDPHYLEHQKLQENGYSVGIGNFENLVFRNGGVYYKDNKIETIRLSMNSGRFSGEEYELLKKSEVKFINTFDMAGLADKSLLEYIDNELIMKTYSLTEKNKNKFVNLKNNYVLKPTNLNEGIGVIIGPDTDQKEWEELINKNTDNNYLLQEFITIQKKEATLYENGGTITDKFYYDYCPHLFYKNGKLLGVGHTLVRYSKNKIVNVLRGGGIGYVLHQ